MDNRELQKSLYLLNYEYLKWISGYPSKSYFKVSIKNKFIHFLNLIQVFRYLGIKKAFKFIQNRNKVTKGDSFSVEQLIPKGIIKARIVVYTSIFGNIDNILEPLFTPENIDYRIITDQEINYKTKWKKINIDSFNELNEMSNQRKNRYCKMFPQKFFPEYEYSIYVDGNILIVGDMSILVERLEGKHVGIFKHPKRNDIYDEAAAVIYLGNAPGKNVKEQLDNYKAEGFPTKFGLFENSLIVRKHNSHDVIRLMNLWWKQVNIFTIRDQLSFMYCLWRLGYEDSFVASLGDNIDLCPLIRRISHINKR